MQRLWFALTTAAGPPLLAVSLAGWAALFWAGELRLVPHLHAVSPSWEVPGGMAWLLMVIAMMPPLLTDQISHLWTRSLARRRWRQILLFATAYIFFWMTAGWLLVSSAVHLINAVRSGLHTSLVAVLLAAFWQATPTKQVCLNRCHMLPPLSAFGFGADRDAVRYGMTAGGWCVGSCWALMLVPVVVEAAHVPVMAVTMMLMLAERHAQCRSATWRLPLASR